MQTGSLIDDLENESWESIARMLSGMPISFDSNHKGLKKIGRELGMIRHVLCQQLLSYNGNKEIDMAFFVSYSKVVSRIENDLESKGIRNNEFMLFLKLLLLKIRKQKLIVKKPREMQNEFKKMKRIVENGESSI